MAKKGLETFPENLEISGCGTKFINGMYRLDKSRNVIRYFKRNIHGLSNKKIELEIVLTNINELNLNKCFVIRNVNPEIHYYIYPLNSNKFINVAGLLPVPIMKPSKFVFNMGSKDKNAKNISNMGSKKMGNKGNNGKSKNKSVQKIQKRNHSNQAKKDEFDVLNTMDIEHTKRIYYEDTYKFEWNSIIKYIGSSVKYGVYIILESTIFHAQGGGQPSDTGIMYSKDKSIIFEVDSVKDYNKEYVIHFGRYKSDKTFNVSDEIYMEIDKQNRLKNACLHSAGHLLDIAMTELNIAKIEPVKGYHYSDGAYVEYKGSLKPYESKENELQNILDKIVNANIKREMKYLDKIEYITDILNIKDDTTIKQISNKMKTDKIRVIYWDYTPNNGICGCGGTHIDNTSRLKRIELQGFKSKRGNFRVKYDIIMT